MVGDGGTVSVLVVDDESHANRLAESLEGASDRIDATAEPDATMALQMVAGKRYDCVVCDYDVPGADGMEFVAALGEAGGDVPIVVVTENGSESVAAEALRFGADDYRRKGEADAETLAACVEQSADAVGDDDSFARMVTHDLRNPLSVATGWLDLYRDSGEETHLDRIEEALDRMVDIIDDVEALSKGDQSPDRQTVDLSAAATAAWEIVDPAEAHLEAEYGPRIRADRSMLQAVFENLFDNAVTYGGPDVTVTVGAFPDRDGFFVADDGPGIPEDERQQVFERGYSGGHGTGMGLTIVSCIAGAHDWEVVLTESGDGGARFEFHDVSFLDGD